MTILLSAYHIIFIFIGLFTLMGIGYKILNTYLKDAWKKDIDIAIDKQCSEERCKLRISNVVSNKFELVTRDLELMKESLGELKNMINNQQETLLAIQLGLTELKPRLDNLEKRVDKIENKIDHSD